MTRRLILKDRDNKSPLAKIIGTGSFLPPNQYSTEEMKKYFPQIDLDENFKVIGVKTRYFVRNFDTNETSFTNSELTCEAAKLALADAGVKANELDLIVTTTASPDYSIPNMACQVQDQLGASKAAALGILSGCGGFIYALTIATQFIENGFSQKILVTGSEVLSPYLDFSHPKCAEGQALNATIFGDGAGAVILSASDDAGILFNYIGANGKRNPLYLHDSGSKLRPNEQTLRDGLHFWDLNFRAILGLTPKYMGEATQKILKKSGLSLKDIDWIVPHQPTMRIIKKFVKKIGLPSEKALIYVDKVGNLSDAMIPVSLDLARREGKLKKGDVILLVAAGAGWMFGANILKWSL